MKKIFTALFFILAATVQVSFSQNVGINATGALPDPSAMLDIASNAKGLLIPRMTTTERDALQNPATGLYIYNLTTKTFDAFNGTTWNALGYENTAVVNVRSLADLPAPQGGAITLDRTKTYNIVGQVNISPNFINMNGAAVKGTNPILDALISNVAGAILRSTDEIVFLEKLSVVPASSSTSAYNFVDNTGTKSCNLLVGNNVKDLAGVQSLGAGTISGFRFVAFVNNYIISRDGLKLGGNMGRVLISFNSIESLTAGSGIEFLPTIKVNEVVISNNFFVYSGNTGIKVTSGAQVDFARVTANIFTGVTNPVLGVSSAAAGWNMQQNVGIPDSRVYGNLYFNGTTPTAISLQTAGTYYKVNTASAPASTQSLSRFRQDATFPNRMIYEGKRPITAKVYIVVGGKATGVNDYTIALGKNGNVSGPTSSMGTTTSGQAFQLVLISEVDIEPGDYLEVGIKSNSNNTSVNVSDVQFRVTD